MLCSISVSVLGRAQDGLCSSTLEVTTVTETSIYPVTLECYRIPSVCCIGSETGDKIYPIFTNVTGLRGICCERTRWAL